MFISKLSKIKANYFGDSFPFFLISPDALSLLFPCSPGFGPYITQIFEALVHIPDQDAIGALIQDELKAVNKGLVYSDLTGDVLLLL